MGNQSKGKRRRGDAPAREAPPPVDLDAKANVEEDAEPVEARKIELFTLHGEKYFMVEPGANLMLQIMRTARTKGEIAAIGELLEDLIGVKAYDALMGINDLTGDELNAVMERVMHFSMNRLEAMTGN